MNDKMIKVSDYVAAKLEEIKQKEQHKSMDSVIRTLIQHYEAIAVKDPEPEACQHEKGEYIGKLTDPGPYWLCRKCGMAFKEKERSEEGG
jgi:rubrerythrin